MSKPRDRTMGLAKSVAIIATMVLLALIAIPNFVKAKPHYSSPACVNNLRRIDAAVHQFALEHHLTNGTPIDFPSDLTPYLPIKLDAAGRMPKCPAGGIYAIKRVGDTPTCSLGTTVTPEHVLSE